MRGSFVKKEAYVWWPVVLMLCVVMRESTEIFGGAHTSRILRPFFAMLLGHLTDEHWEHVHHGIRKAGHFIGYGTLGLTWLRAFMLKWAGWFRKRGDLLRWSVPMALACTMAVAAADETHQYYIPGRTGLLQDVALDTVGAITLISLRLLIFRPRRTA